MFFAQLKTNTVPKSLYLPPDFGRNQKLMHACAGVNGKIFAVSATFSGRVESRFNYAGIAFAYWRPAPVRNRAAARAYNVFYHKRAVCGVVADKSCFQNGILLNRAKMVFCLVPFHGGSLIGLGCAAQHQANDANKDGFHGWHKKAL